MLYNRYEGRWSPSGKYVVDAPNANIAIQTMIAAKGSEPVSFTLVEAGIEVSSTIPSVKLITEITPIEGVIPGDIYPEKYSVMAGTEIVVTAVSRSGYKFVNWKLNEVIVGDQPELHYTVSTDTKLTATFELQGILEDPKVDTRIGVLEDGITFPGIVYPEGIQSYPRGSLAILTAIPDEGYEFSRWSTSDEITVSTNSEYRFIVDRDIVLVARFVETTLPPSSNTNN